MISSLYTQILFNQTTKFPKRAQRSQRKKNINFVDIVDSLCFMWLNKLLVEIKLFEQKKTLLG
jgi:hypothetical protein